MQEIYRKIDDTGYENISPEVYDRWLKHIEQEKEKENGILVPRSYRL